MLVSAYIHVSLLAHMYVILSLLIIIVKAMTGMINNMAALDCHLTRSTVVTLLFSKMTLNFFLLYSFFFPPIQKVPSEPHSTATAPDNFPDKLPGKLPDVHVMPAKKAMNQSVNVNTYSPSPLYDKDINPYAKLAAASALDDVGEDNNIAITFAIIMCTYTFTCTNLCMYKCICICT